MGSELPPPLASAIRKSDIWRPLGGIYPLAMLGTAVICVAVAVVLASTWHFAWVAHYRHKSREILRWLERALDARGQLLGIRWVQPSTFEAALRLRTTVFQRPSICVHLRSHEMPLSWVKSWWQRQPDTLVFAADLDYPPGFNLEVRNHRWCGRTTHKFSPDPRQWKFAQSVPVVLTSRDTWKREVASMMNTLLNCREREFLSLSFQSHSPHFTAIVPLASISPQMDGMNVFEMLRELAAGASSTLR